MIKNIPGWQDEYQSSELMDFEDFDIYLRLVTVDMDPDDTMYICIPAGSETKSISRLMKDIFPDDSSEREKVKETLETEDWPELPNIYDYFYSLFADERAGRSIIDISINQGPENINKEDLVHKHLAISKEIGGVEVNRVLHLIMEIHNVAFGDYADQKDAEKEKKALRGLYLYNAVYSKKGIEIDESKIYGELEEAVNYCKENDLIKEKNVWGKDSVKLALTKKGKEYYEELTNEAGYYVDNYEVFSRVYHDEDYIRFNHVEGQDYRIEAMRADGVNVYRAVMVMSLINGTFNETIENWEEELHSPNFFDRYLGACSNQGTDLTDSEFDMMMSEGKKYRQSFEDDNDWDE